LFLFIGLFSFLLPAQEDGGKKLRINRKNPIVKTRLGFSPIIALYGSNKNHTANTKQKVAFSFSLKEEIRIDRKNQSFIFIGADYIQHGVSFNSYFFYSDSIALYDQSYRYKYNLTIHELNFPLQFKYSFQRENNSIYSSYVFAGYCYRWLVTNNLNVAGEGENIVTKKTDLRFKLPAFSYYNNSFFSLGFGAQKNLPLRHNAVFIEAQYKYGLSPIYFKESFTASSLYFNTHFLMITVGVKI
jgi:hypothetical protein